MSYHYLVQVPLSDGNWFTLCRCLSPESAAEVVAALLKYGNGQPGQVLVVVVGTGIGPVG